MTRADRILVFALAALLLAVWPIVASARVSGQRAEISGPGGTSYVDLSKDATLIIEGRTGDLTVVVERGAVRVKDAECPDRVCIETGRVSASGEVVACVPNGVVIRVTGGERDGFDARIR